jgi:hypothetical protein
MSTLVLLRDDGPLARALGRLLAPPAVAAVLAGGAPLIAAIAVRGDSASQPLAGLVIAWLVLAGSLSRGATTEGRLAWAVAPLVRLFEYAALLWIGALAGATSEPAAFALLAALAFHHYDLVYRPRHLGAPPPRWVGDLAGGWDGRLALGYILLVAGALPAGFLVAAALLATLFVAESISGWRSGDRARRPAIYDDQEDMGQ